MHFHPEWDSAMRQTPSSAARPPAPDDSGAGHSRRLSATRAALLRERVRSGYYASPAAMDQLSERVAASGDL
ncbi:MAG: hypothetical protein JWN79_3244 [Gemmatimonadetes bacterium]|nr:hypothetical protein [Gemmatimonadota bacterium]